MENQEEVHDVLTSTFKNKKFKKVGKEEVTAQVPTLQFKDRVHRHDTQQDVFEKKPSADIPQILEEYLKTVAKTGKTLFPWNRIKTLFITKVEQVMDQFNRDVPYDHLPLFPNVENTKYIEMQRRIIEAMDRFTGAPFTVQRICELVTQPRKHYTRCDKFLRGIEKNVMVVSTVDPFGRKIVSESSRLMVNGLDTNGFQKGDFNDFTEGQPFGPVLQSNWSNNNSASVWPSAGVLDNVESLQKLSATAAGESLDPNINAANPQTAIPTSSGEITSSDKFSEAPVSSNISSDSSGFSALFQEKPIENEHLSSPTGLQSLSGAQGTDPLRGEENTSEEGVSNASADSEQQELNSEAGASGEGSPVLLEKSQEDEVSSQDKEVPPDPIDTTSPEDEGPPEKKLRQEEEEEKEEAVDEKASPETVTSETTKEFEPVQSTEEPQSTSDEGQQTIPEPSAECNEKVQKSDDSEVSQSDISTEPHTQDSTTDEQTTAPADDQTVVTSTEDSEQAENTEESVLSNQTDSCADKESSGENEPESSVEDVKAENQEENEVDSEVPADISEKDSDRVEVTECDVSKEEADCSSATEMMETDTATEEKSQTDTPSTTEEAMEQD